MINYRQILILIVFLISWINVGLSQKLDKTKKNWGEIESIFQNVASNSKFTKHCSFEYKKEEQIDVDLWDKGYKLLLSDIDKSNVIKLVDYYIKFCNECDSSSMIHKFLKERNSFLADDFYSIDLHYKIVKRETLDILILIYSKGGYILFTMGFREDKK